MADNKQLPPTGTGTADIVVATDEIGGVDYQKIKLVDGTADSTTAAKVSAEGALLAGVAPGWDRRPSNSAALGALDAAYTLNASGAASAAILIVSSNLSGFLAFEGSIDGVTYQPVYGYEPDTPNGYIGGLTDPIAETRVFLPVSPYESIRARISSYTSGSLTLAASLSAVPGDAISYIWDPEGIFATVTQQGLQTTALQIIDDWDESDRAKVNLIAGQVGVQGGAGASTALTQRVAIATDANAISGTVTANLAAGSNNIGDVDVLSVPSPLSTAGNGTAATAHRVTLASDSTGQVAVASIAAGDNNIGNVDVVSLPALVAGTANIGDVDVLTMPNVTLAAGTNTNEVVGDVAQDQPIAGNPVQAGWRASTAVPAAMSGDGDVVYPWANRSGAPVVTAAPHVGLNSDPWNLVHEAAQYTSTQTSTVLVAGGASEKLVVTKVQIQVAGTTAGDLQLYFGTGAFSRGTSRTIFDGTFKPSATLAPGVVMDGPFISGTNGDDLMVTTSAAINPITVNVWYYVVT